MEPSAGDARCFGCGPENEAGLHLDFRQTGTATVECTCVVPAPLGEPLTARAELVRVEGPNVFVRGALLRSDGTELTTAEARWKVTGLAEE